MFNRRRPPRDELIVVLFLMSIVVTSFYAINAMWETWQIVVRMFLGR